MGNEATVTSKGQVTIPAEIRQRLGIEAGHKLAFYVQDDGSLGVRVRKMKVGSGRGILKKLGVELPPGDLKDVIEEARSARAAEIVDKMSGSD